jgi:4-diphosphocytidyl-2-C-methyl-D-erythritol kinase
MLLDRPLSTPGLASLGARLGADVPVFVDGLPARVEGTGESVSPVRLPTQLALVLCSDRHVLSTKLVFSSLDVLSLTSGERPSNISNFIGGQLPAEGVLFNDLEEAAVRLHPDVSLLKNLLLDLGATGALMTGSGSAVFGIFCDPDQATEAATRLQAQGLWAAAVETLRCSPVVEV